MNSSRILALTKAAGFLHRGLLNKNSVSSALKIPSRQSGGHFYYRKAPEPLPEATIFAKCLNGMMWWWILWHFFTEYEELIGFHIPDPSEWTDEELGIPKD